MENRCIRRPWTTSSPNASRKREERYASGKRWPKNFALVKSGISNAPKPTWRHQIPKVVNLQIRFLNQRRRNQALAASAKVSPGRRFRLQQPSPSRVSDFRGVAFCSEGQPEPWRCFSNRSRSGSMPPKKSGCRFTLRQFQRRS